MKPRITAILPASLILLLLVGLTACNTMEGAGEDIESTGETIEEGAE